MPSRSLDIIIGGKDATGGAFASVNSRLAAASKSATRIGAGIGAALGTLAAGSLASMIKDTVDVADAQSDMAAQLGVSAAALTRLQYAANLGGSSASAMDAALGKLNKTLGDSVFGGGAASGVLRQLGLDAQALAKLAPDQAFAEIAEEVSKIESPSERARVAMTLFGKSGQDVINVLMLGKAGLRAFAEESDRTGFTLTENAERAIDTADKAVKRAEASLEGLKRTGVTTLAPMISWWDKNLQKFNQTEGALGKLGRLTTPGVIYTQWIEGDKAVTNYAASVDKATKSVAAFKSTASTAWMYATPPPPEQYEDAQGKILAGFVRQQEEFGMTGRQLDLYRLAMYGASQETLQFAQSLDRSISEMERTVRINDSLESFFSEVESGASEAAKSVKSVGEALASTSQVSTASLVSSRFIAGQVTSGRFAGDIATAQTGAYSFGGPRRATQSVSTSAAVDATKQTAKNTDVGNRILQTIERGIGELVREVRKQTEKLPVFGSM